MSKKLGIIAILAIFMLAGTVPFVMGAGQLPPALNEKMIKSGLIGSESNVSSVSMQHSIDVVYGTPSPDTWYYGKVDDVWPWMISDCTTFNLKSDGILYTFSITPVSTVDGWNNAFMQNQIVDCLISADANNHYINVHTDGNCQIDMVRLTATRM